MPTPHARQFPQTSKRGWSSRRVTAKPASPGTPASHQFNPVGIASLADSRVNSGLQWITGRYQHAYTNSTQLATESGFPRLRRPSFLLDFGF